MDEALLLKPSNEESTWEARFHKSYANMVGPYGGITLAQALQSVMIDKRRQGDPTSITMNYVAPIQASTYNIKTALKKTNRSTQHWSADFIQDGEVVACAIIMCAVRKGAFDHLDETMPAAPPPESLSRSEVRYPEWVSRYDMRFVTGQPSLSLMDSNPPSPALMDSSSTIVWIKDIPDRPFDFPSLSAVCDAFFPRIYILRPVFCPAGTVSITVYLHICGDELSALGSDFLLGEARGTSFHRGYADQTARLWTRGGRLVATSTQIVYFKA